LRARYAELERATLARVYGVSDPASIGDPAYLAGLRAAVAAALSYGIVAIDPGAGRRPQTLPPELAVQARYAARTGVCLDTVLRRYFAGYALLCDFIVEEAEEKGPLEGTELQGILRAEAALLDRLVIAVTAEYTKEAEELAPLSTEQRRSERVKGLLVGESVDSAELRYEMDAWHLGLIASGAEARETAQDLAARLGRVVLAVRSEGETIWAWLGGRERLDTEHALDLIAHHQATGVSLALGEPAHGLEGWRLTHNQAAAVLPIALRTRQSVVRYADVALLASVIRDDVLSRSLESLYLAPLSRERDGGEVLRQTLRAYFAAERNVSSAAAGLGVSRKTVASRLRAIERLLGRSLGACAPEMEAALRLEEFGHLAPAPPAALSSIS
jgi:hypothetical protein